jgi:hypothetical protein
MCWNKSSDYFTKQFFFLRKLIVTQIGHKFLECLGNWKFVAVAVFLVCISRSFNFFLLFSFFDENFVRISNLYRVVLTISPISSPDV